MNMRFFAIVVIFFIQSMTFMVISSDRIGLYPARIPDTLQYAAIYGRSEKVTRFLSDKIKYSQDALMASLFNAARGGHTKVVLQLIEDGANPNGEKGAWNPLMAAIVNGQLDAAKELISQGAQELTEAQLLKMGTCSPGMLPFFRKWHQEVKLVKKKVYG